MKMGLVGHPYSFLAQLNFNAKSRRLVMTTAIRITSTTEPDTLCQQSCKGAALLKVSVPSFAIKGEAVWNV